MLIPNKHCGFMADGTRLAHIDSGGGGGGGGGQTTSYTTNVPEYAKEPFMEMIGKGVALSEAPYQAYGGERTAQFTPLQRQAFGQAERQGVAGQLGQATGIAGLAAQQGLQAGQFQPGTFTPMAAQAPQLTQFQMGAPMRVGTQSFIQPGTAEQFMNPFMQNVVDIQKREAQRAADIAGTQRGAQAVRAGAFGGSRQAIMEAEAQRNLAQQMGDIQATGSQAAFQQAQEQFNREQQARLQAQMANQQAGLTAGGQNLQAALGVQQLGAQTGMQAQLANQQALMDAQRAFEQSRQFGADLGLRGGAQALQGANVLGQLGQQQFGQEMDIMGARERMGGSQQQQIQRILDQQYADFQAQRDFPYQQLGFLSDLLRGTGSSTRTVFQSPQPNQMAQLAGAGLSAYGLMRAEGGEIPAPKKYAAGGGITGLLPDQQLQERMGSPTVATIAKMAAEKELMDRNQLREGIAAMQQAVPQMPTQTVAEEMLTQMGIGGLPVPDEVMPDAAMAGGGIVAFQSGGPIVLPAGTPRDVVEQTRLDNPGVEVRTEDEGSAWRALGQNVRSAAQGVGDFLTYNSDVAAQQARTAEAAMADPRAGRGVNRNTQAEAPAATPAAPSGIAQGAQQTQGGAPAPVAAARPTGIASLSPAARMAEVKRLAGDGSQLREQARAIGESDIAAREEYARSLEADQAEGAQFWSDMRKKVESKVEGLSKQEYDAKTNQILGIGAALLGTKSENLGTALGEALGVGLKMKREDEDRIRKARDDLMARQDELAALERGEKRGDKKELREARMGVNNAKTELAKSLYQVDKDAFDREFDLAKASVDAFAKEQSAQSIAATYAGGRSGGAGAGGLTENQKAQLRDKAIDNVDRRLKDNIRLQNQVAKNPGMRERLVQEEMAMLFNAQQGTLPTGAAQGNTRMRFDAQGNLIQ